MKNDNVPPSWDAKALFVWAEKYGITLLPCEPKSKKPNDPWISTRWVYPNGDAPKEDSFHNPTPERLAEIKKYWAIWKNPKYSKWVDETKFSASVDTNYPTSDGYTIGCVDVDRDDLYSDALNIDPFKECPAVRAKKGIKFLFKLDPEQLPPEKIIQYYAPEPDKKLDEESSEKHPALEVFAKDRHMLIFGEHPDSTAEHRIYYTPVRNFDNPIPVLEWIDVKNVIESFAKDHNIFTRSERREKGVKPKTIKKNEGRKYFPSSDDLRVEDFLTPLKAKRQGSHLQGEHPIHGSGGGMNLSVDPLNNVWYCFRCSSGGGALEAAAVAAGIIDCIDAKPGWRTPERMSAVYEWLREHGHKIPRSLCLRQVTPLSILTENVKESDALPKSLPDSPVVLLEAPPRTGKTHIAVDWMCQHSTASYITHSHSVVDQAVGIFRAIRPKNMTGVHLEGRGRCCRNPGQVCKECYLNPSNSIERHEFELIVKEYLDKAKVLTKDTVPEDFCPYYVLSEAANHATHIFTVVDLFSSIPPPEFTVIDEDTSIAKFYPSSVELLEVFNGRERDSVTRKFEHVFSKVQEIKDTIQKKLSRLRPSSIEFAEQTALYELLLACVGIITSICEVCSACRYDVNRTEVLENLNKINFTLPEGDKIRALKMAKEIEYKLNAVNSLVPFLMSILFPYTKMRFNWIGANPASLYMIADEEMRIYPPPSGKLLIIGDTRAELFVKSLNCDCSVVNVKKFQFSDQFVVVMVEKDKLTTGKESIQNLMHRVNPDVNLTRRVPSLVLTGSEKEQENGGREFKGLAHMSKGENRTGQMWNYAFGGFNFFYQGSVISRGVDVEFYHLLFALGTNFVTPYWQTVKKVAEQEKDTARKDFAAGMLDAILVDETTNSILRISPTKNINNGKLRLVFINESDEWKIRKTVLDGTHIIRVNPAQISDSVWGHIQNSYGVDLQVPNGYPTENRSISSGTIANENAEKDPDWTIDDYMREFQNDNAPSSDSLNLVPAASIDKAKEIIMGYMHSRAKMGKRISLDSLNRWAMNRLPKNIPDDNKVIIIRGAINLLIQEGHVAMENNLDGVPMISWVKSLMDVTPQTTMNKGVV